MAPDWAEELAPVDEQLAAMGRFLRGELAAGRTYLPAGDAILRAAIAAWRQLQPEQQQQRKGELLEKLYDYEMRANRRGPSQDALRDQYDIP